MTGLVIKLKPNEKVLINGVVLQNSGRSAKIRVRTNDVSILRARDAIPPDAANTPLRRIYYIAQLAVAGDTDPVKADKQIQIGIDQLRKIFNGDSKIALDQASGAAREQKFFVVMRSLKKLFEIEDALLAQSAVAS